MSYKKNKIINFLQTIISYYQGESRHGFWGAVIGGLLLIGGFILWKWTSPLSLLKGFSVPMLFFGLLVGIGGGADSFHTNKMTPGKIALYNKDSTAFLKQEKVKVGKTHRGWHGIRIFWTLLGLGGLLLSFLIRKPFWIGAGLGTFALAIIISLFEQYSMHFNELYYQAIQSATAQEPNINTNEINFSVQRQVKMQQTAIEPRDNKQTQAKPTSGTLPPQILPFDSLKSLFASGITAVVVRDSVNINIPDGLQLPALTNKTGPGYHNDKKRKVLDYYNVDLIQTNSVNAKHCWFGKKYNKG